MREISPLKAAIDIWRTGRKKPEDISALQQSRLEDFLSFVRKNSRFYAKKYKNFAENAMSFPQLPHVTKSELMDNFDDWVTDPAITLDKVQEFVSDMSRVGHPFLGGYSVLTTSGSTGVPVILIQDPYSLTIMQTVISIRGVKKLKGHDMWKLMVNGGRNASICSTTGHFGAYATAERMRLNGAKTKIFSIHTPLPTLVKELNEYQPSVVGGYPTMVEVLAEEQKSGRLHIDPVMIAFAGEQLYPHVRTKIESAFKNAFLLNFYGCSEAAGLTYECKENHFHINSDWVIVEPVDENYQPVPPGEQSHSVLITNLVNRVQPIVRYELTDRIILSPDPCKCGSPFPFLHVEGRTDDILKFSAPNGEMVHILPLALKTIVEKIPGVRRFQVIQTSPSQLTVRLEEFNSHLKEEVWEKIKKQLFDYLESQRLTNISIIKSEERPKKQKSGKFNHVFVDYHD
jgi:phenylacetate-coenzyme A ligase PaaK-like adenylate-forming protein